MSQTSLKSHFQKIKNELIHLPKGLFYNIKYGFPTKKLTLIGITGTDGKTTTCTLIYEILKEAGYKTGLITTIGAKLGDKEMDTGLHTTSPDPALLQQMFSEMVKAGLTHVVCEVTSHALDQHRFYGCNFTVGAITNTSHEHLDYHHSMENYIASKAKLFEQSNLAILNADDYSFKQLKETISIPFKTFSVKVKSDYQAKEVKLDTKQLKFKVNDTIIRTDSNYSYQAYNILTALAVVKELGVDPKIVQKVVAHFPETKGRREEVSNNFKFRTIVDFAHTPAALESTLNSLKTITSGNLIAIFGATGGRDSSKRPIMGDVVSKIANIAIITADDTRNENIEDINQQIISGIDSKKSECFDYQEINSNQQYSKVSQLAKEKFVYFNVPNRQDAFNLAIKLAQTGDTVIACGKGHETTILHGSTEYPWSESEAFRTAFRLRNIQ
jgi:UDP-N-acetylmuramoyl-L-alanyl-D-glutamate--2,6-diaminopimelate ligase